MNDAARLTIILPTYNEAANIAELVPRIEECFAGHAFRILVVDDASPDGTAAVAARLGERYGNVEVLTPPVRKGLGAALRYGYDYARTPYILSSDADLSFSPEQMLQLYETILERGDDLVQGTRHETGGRYEVAGFRVWLKRLASVTGNVVVRVVAGLPVTDCSANFRVIRRDAWERIETRENTNAILFEMIFKCHHGGLRVSSIPVTFRDRRYGESKLNLVTEIPKFLMRMLYYVARYRLTTYPLKEAPVREEPPCGTSGTDRP
jgi:dolichol-phosphate mannosyltransferase